MASTEVYILYLLLGTVAAMIYSLRKIYALEYKIEAMEERILAALIRRKASPAKKIIARKAKPKRRKRRK